MKVNDVPSRMQEMKSTYSVVPSSSHCISWGGADGDERFSNKDLLHYYVGRAEL